jgi:hypothetical protein
LSIVGRLIGVSSVEQIDHAIDDGASQRWGSHLATPIPVARQRAVHAAPHPASIVVANRSAAAAIAGTGGPISAIGDGTPPDGPLVALGVRGSCERRETA